VLSTDLLYLYVLYKALLDTFVLFLVVLLLGVGLRFIKASLSSSQILYLLIHFTWIGLCSLELVSQYTAGSNSGSEEYLRHEKFWISNS